MNFHTKRTNDWLQKSVRNIYLPIESERSMIVMEGETTKHLKPRAMIVSNSSNSLLKKNLDEDQDAYVHSKSGHQLQ